MHQIRYTKYADVEPYGLQEIFQTTDNIGKFSYRKGDGVHGWRGWKTITTNSDIPNLFYSLDDKVNIGSPAEAIKSNWLNMPDGNYICQISVGSVHTALVQKIENGNYGSVYVISYGLTTPLYIRKELESWIVK